jgi:hypothetical protein
MNSDNLNILLVPRQPWCLRTVRPHSEVTNGLWSFGRQHQGAVVRFLRGKKMATVQGLYDEFAAALQFPDYFGYNAGAFDECLADLSWLPAKMYVLTIFDSADFLTSEPAQAPLFIDAFERIAAQWSTPIAQGESWDRPAVPFHVIFHCVADDVRRLPARLTAITGVI